MIELCRINRLKVVRDTPQGLYLEENRAGDTDSVKEKITKPDNRESHFKKADRASAAKFTGDREDVLLPRPEVPDGVKPGDELDVFIYLDSSDRYTATLKTPKICLGVPAFLKVVQVTDIGVFLDWGLEKNLLLPFSEMVRPFYFDPVGGALRQAQGTLRQAQGTLRQVQGTLRQAQGTLRQAQGTLRQAQGTFRPLSKAEFAREIPRQGQGAVSEPGFTGLSTGPRGDRERLTEDELAWIEEGRELPVVLYIDKSGRPAASMRVYEHLSVGGKYEKDSAVEAAVVQINPQMGVFVAVDDRYFGMININEITDIVNVGDRLFGRISGVRDDGKYMVSLTQKTHLQMDNDAQVIFRRIKEAGGVLPLGDKSDAKDIMRELGMSKKAFKRAVGQLYKEGKVVPGESEVKILQNIAQM